jgi:hypothetical protein
METPVTDISDRYFTAFIGLDSQRDFFVGFADYLDFILKNKHRKSRSSLRMLRL